MATSKKPTNRRWVIFVLACLTSFLLYLHRYTFNFIGPQLQKEYGFSQTKIGFFGSMFNWTYGSLQIPSGLVADLFGPHFFLGCIIALWSIALALHGAGPGWLGASRLIFGATQAGAYPSLSRVTRDWFPRSTRTTVQGFVATFFGRGGGFMSSIILGTVLMGYFELSWQVSLLWMSALGIVFALIFLLFFRNSPQSDPRVNEAERRLINEGPETTDKPPRLASFLDKAARNRSMWFFVIQQMFNAGADNIYSLFMGGYFLTVKGVDLQQAGLFVGLPLLGGAIGGMLGGLCNDLMIAVTRSRRWGRRLVGFLGKAIACGLMFVAISQDNPTAAAWSLFWVKFFSDWSQPTVWGTCTDLGGKYSASIFSILNTSGTIGGIICPPLFGWILDHFATLNEAGQSVPGYMTLFTVVAAMYIASAVCWFGIDCSRPIISEDQS